MMNTRQKKNKRVFLLIGSLMSATFGIHDSCQGENRREHPKRTAQKNTHISPHMKPKHEREKKRFKSRVEKKGAIFSGGLFPNGLFPQNGSGLGDNSSNNFNFTPSNTGTSGSGIYTTYTNVGGNRVWTTAGNQPPTFSQ